jgi:hypothetical protein
MSFGDPSYLQGSLGARAAEESRLGEFWPKEYEKQNHGTHWEPVQFVCSAKINWKEVEDFGHTVDFDQAVLEYGLEDYWAMMDGPFKKAFFSRLEESKRHVAFVRKALYREVHNREQLYLLLSLVTEFDNNSERQGFFKEGACKDAGLSPLVPLFDFVAEAFERAEQMIIAREKKAARQSYLVTVRKNGKPHLRFAFRTKVEALEEVRQLTKPGVQVGVASVPVPHSMFGALERWCANAV